MQNLILHPDRRTTLSDKNLTAYWHYLECEACGRFPDDRIVRENAARIRFALQQARAIREHETHELMRSLIG